MKKYLILFLLLSSCAPGTRYTLHEDNDIFKPTKNNDRDFSQGFRMAMDVPNETGSTGYFFGQNFYTPGGKQLTEPQPSDRPYAGFLYAGTDFKRRVFSNRQDVFGVTVGIVGPHSYAEQAQNNVHRWLGQNTVKGWDNQLGDEIGIILKAERNYALLHSRQFDIVSTAGAHLGNVFTQLYTGANFRWGYNLNDPFASPSIIYPRIQKVSPWSAYVHGGTFGRFVAHNIFLDGNTFRDSLSVDKEPFVAEGRLGFALEHGLYRFAYTYIIQTKEYENEPGANDFGELTLSIGWQ